MVLSVKEFVIVKMKVSESIVVILNSIKEYLNVGMTYFILSKKKLSEYVIFLGDDE
jgi:uncharacterized protein YutD